MSGGSVGLAVRFGRFELQPAARVLLVDGAPAALGARAFDVLMALVERRQAPVSKDHLLQLVWPASVVEENTLQVHISALRKILGPMAISTIAGRGYRFTAELDADDAPAAAPGALSMAPPATPHNLPQPRTRFIGRETSLALCMGLLQTTRLLTLTGIGGCGKTRLALALAQRRLAAFADGVWFVDLAPLQDGQRVAPAVAAVLGLPDDGTTPLLARLQAHLAPRGVLIVLDNCEHLIDAAATLADALLGGCAQLCILATSREALGVTGEQLVPVQPLCLPAASDLAAVRDSDAVRLFADRAGLVAPGFVLDEGNAAAVADICCRLDGIALAIELAAARVGMLPVAEISARLGQRFRFLTGGSRALPRHQTLLAVLQWSHDSLSPAEQRLFMRLGVFAGGCTLAAATVVADSGDEHSVLALLQRLHDRSLLLVQHDVQHTEPAPPRYRMLETVRQYAMDRLDAAGDADASRDRHLHWVVALAERALAEVQGPQQGAWMQRLAQEQANLLAAHRWCEHAVQGPHAAIRLVACLWRYWVASAQLETGHALAEQALARAPADTAALWHGRAHWALGQIAFRMGRYGQSLAQAEVCLALAASVGDAELTAISLGLRAKALHSSGQLALARQHYLQACSVARTLASPFWLGTALNNLAELHRSVGQFDAAEACYAEAVEISRRLQSPEATFVPLCNLARLAVASGQLERARLLLQDSLNLAAGAGLTAMGEDLLDVAAGLASARGEFSLAARFAGAAAARMQEGGSQREPVDQAFIAPLLARASAALGTAAYAAAEAQGRAWSHAAAVSEVRRWAAQGSPAPADVGAQPAG